jgi:signal peptidase I
LAKASDIKPAKVEKPKETALEFIASMAVVLVTGLFIITFTLQAFEIPSSSMEQTLLIGDHVFVDRITYAPETKWMPIVPYADIGHGDIVVFLSPSEPGLHVVKRVIGLPGDRLQLRQGTVYRNGEPLTESYVYDSPTGSPSAYRDNFPLVPPDFGTNVTPAWRLEVADNLRDGQVVVPEGRYFVMGDNREWSLDSRYWGFVPRENIIGRPTVIYWSFDTPADQYQKISMKERALFIFRVVLRFFPDTRWNRTLKRVQ